MSAREMLDATTLEEWLAEQQRSRRGWEEPNGWLVPTEPSAMQRHLVRMRLDVQIATLMRVLCYPKAEIDVFERRSGIG